MKRNITSDEEKNITEVIIVYYDGYIAGNRESSIYLSGVDSDTSVWGWLALLWKLHLAVQ